MYMLDTDICIYTIKQKPVAVLRRLEHTKSGEVCMSAITYAELMHGAQKSRYVAENTAKLETLAELIEIVPFDKHAAASYGRVRTDLEKQGELIGGNDLFIAAHALCRGDILVTNNEREFSRVTGLTIENWVKT
jgi:tRNA(fMet)-specific endonuclease VapC